MNFTRLAHTLVFKAKKASPDILLGVGIAGLFAAEALTVRKVYNHKEDIDAFINKMKEVSGELDKDILSGGKDGKPKGYFEVDRVTLYKNMTEALSNEGVDMVKPFVAPALIFATSVGAILWSHTILKNRVALLTATSASLLTAFNSYREKVEHALGEEEEKDIFASLAPDPKEVTKDGLEVKHNLADVSPYAMWFDENNPYWHADPSLTLDFLRLTQRRMNDKLVAQGHLFLNEVYDELGFHRTKAGAIVGWIYDEDSLPGDAACAPGDGFVDFGIYDGDLVRNRRFVNGDEDKVILDFNVDGVIWELI